MKEKIKTTIIIILMIALGVSIYFNFVGKVTENKEKISPIVYKELNEECEKYGAENWDSDLDYSDNHYTIRQYKYSIPLETCVMNAEHNFNDGREIWELRDIYLDKEVVQFNSICRDIYESADLSFEEMNEKCPTKSDFTNRKFEVLEK